LLVSQISFPQAPADGRWRIADCRSHRPSAISYQREARMHQVVGGAPR
jgi:hypothetical protein